MCSSQNVKAFMMDLECIFIFVAVIKLDGSVPVKYGLRLNSEGRYCDVKQQLHILTGIPPHQIMLSELANAQIKVSIYIVKSKNKKTFQWVRSGTSCNISAVFHLKSVTV